MEGNNMVISKISFLCFLFFSCIHPSANKTTVMQAKGYTYWENLPENQKKEILSSDLIYKDAVAFFEGRFKLSDDNRTFNLLDTISSFRSNNEKFRSFYFYVFNQICIKSDGSVSESLGNYCLRAILNATEYHLNYFAINKNILKIYAQSIGYELYFKEEGTSDMEYNYADFKTLLSKKIDGNKEFSNTLNILFLEIEKAMKNMD